MNVRISEGKELVCNSIMVIADSRTAKGKISIMSRFEEPVYCGLVVCFSCPLSSHLQATFPSWTFSWQLVEPPASHAECLSFFS